MIENDKKTKDSNMQTLQEIKKQIALVQEAKAKKDWYDEQDQWGLYGYLHALLWVLDVLQPKYKGGE